MKNKRLSFLSVFLAALLVPYLMTFFLNGADTAFVNRQPSLEMYLPAVVSLQIGKDSEPETVKCQTVIARTNLYRRLQEGETLFQILEEAGRELEDTCGLFSLPAPVYEKAARETAGKVLLWKGKLVLAPYHLLSSGTTRDGLEVFHSEEYAYLKSVDSSADKNSPDYLGSSLIAARQLPKELVVKQRDSAGYILELAADNNVLEGEAFRQGMGLASANFTVQKLGERYRFLCKGKGHGLGFSQYGGNALAKEGADWEEILKAYFPELEQGDIGAVFAKN